MLYVSWVFQFHLFIGCPFYCSLVWHIQINATWSPACLMPFAFTFLSEYIVFLFIQHHTHTHTIHLLTVLHKSNVNFQFSFRRMSKGETFLFPILTGKVKHNRRNKSDCTKTTREKKIPCFECVSHLFYDYYDLSVEWIERSSIKKQNIGGRFWWFEHSYV